MRDQFRGEFDDPCSGNVRDHDIERAVDLAKSSERCLDPTAHGVDSSIAFCRFHGIGLDIDRHHVCRTKLERAES